LFPAFPALCGSKTVLIRIWQISVLSVSQSLPETLSRFDYITEK